MSLNNLWSLNHGGVLGADEILDRVTDCRVYFPVHDTVIDFLVAKGDRHFGVQVKESKYYADLEVELST